MEQSIKTDVNFVCATILSGRNTSRRFDSCFENGTERNKLVAASVYKRALKNNNIMAALDRYLDVQMCKSDYLSIYA